MDCRKTSMSAMLKFFVLCFAVLTAAVPMPQKASTDAAVAASSYWIANIQRQGTVAFGDNAGYKIYRNVKDYGAVGDGNADDTAAINQAISDGNRCGLNCDSSTITPAIIYFPPGSYKVSAPIIMYYYSQLIGDATSLPSLVAASNFQGLSMLDADPYIPGGNGAQWYTNQNNFYRQVRNFVIDLRQLPANQASSGIHWQVSQATSLQNIRFEMAPKGSDTKQVGMFIENGSGGFMSDLIFNGGDIGMNVGNQQFTTRNVTFNGCNTAINLLWDWLWTFKSISFQNCDTGINMASLSDQNQQQVGSVLLIDSSFTGTGIGITTAHSANSQPTTGGTLIVQNVDFTGASKAIADPNGNAILAGGAKVASWAQGNAYLPAGAVKRAEPVPAYSSYAAYGAPPSSMASIASATPVSPATNSPSVVAPSAVTSSAIVSSGSQPSAVTTPFASYGNFSSTLGGGNFSVAATACSASATPVSMKRIQQGLTAPTIPANLLDGSGSVYQRSKPQYENLPASSFISVKSSGAKGDGVTDDTEAIQNVLNSATSDQVVYFDHGAYIITKTVQVPKNIKITGEIWPLIMTKGSFFGDVNNPQPAFRIGNPGDVGSVEISDLIFETAGPAPGAIMMQWNVAQSSQGSAAIWDTHFRVGGTAGTELLQDTCSATDPNHKVFIPECAGSFMMMHVTQQANAYLENTWFWVADHDLDSAGHSQLNIFNGRGLLIESKGPTWLWGTSSEHSVFYNYQVSNAQNVFMGTLQTETAYWQSQPDSLSGGFTPNTAFSDPDFSDCTGASCKKTWGLRVVGSSDIYMFGGGMYSFYESYTQQCLDSEDCQTSMVDLQCSSNVFLYGLVTKASVNQVNVNGQPAALQKDNTNGFGSTIALFQQN